MNTERGLLDGTVRLVILQFSFSNIRLIPSWLLEKRVETRKLDIPREKIKGTQLFQCDKDLYVLPVISGLAEAGFVMVDAFFKWRSDGHGRQYSMVSFVLGLKKTAHLEDEFAEYRERSNKALALMCEQAMWRRVRGFRNSFFLRGEVVDGLYVVSIDLARRIPLLDRDGKRLVHWTIEDTGKIDDEPVPIEPKSFLKIIDGNFCAV